LKGKSRRLPEEKSFQPSRVEDYSATGKEMGALREEGEKAYPRIRRKNPASIKDGVRIHIGEETLWKGEHWGGTAKNACAQLSKERPDFPIFIISILPRSPAIGSLFRTFSQTIREKRDMGASGRAKKGATIA